MKVVIQHWVWLSGEDTLSAGEHEISLEELQALVLKQDLMLVERDGVVYLRLGTKDKNFRQRG